MLSYAESEGPGHLELLSFRLVPFDSEKRHGWHGGNQGKNTRGMESFVFIQLSSFSFPLADGEQDGVIAAEVEMDIDGGGWVALLTSTASSSTQVDTDHNQQ